MNVLQRKMFKNPNGRNARDKLKGMGGIMSSSPELANVVQGYEEAGQVTIANENARMMAELAKAYKDRTDSYITPFSYEGGPFDEFPIDFLGKDKLQDIPEGFKSVPMFNEDGSIKGYTTMPIEGSGITEVVPDFATMRIDDAQIEEIYSAIDEYNEDRGIPAFANIPANRRGLLNAIGNIAEWASWPVLRTSEGMLALYDALWDNLPPEYIQEIMEGKIKAEDVPNIEKVLKDAEANFSDQEFLVEGRIVERATEEKPKDADVVGRYDEEGFRRRPAEELLFQGADKPTTDQPSIQQRLREIEKMKAGAGKGPGLPEEMTKEFMRQPYDPDDKLKKLQQQAFEDYKLELQKEEARRMDLEAGAGKGPGANLTDGLPGTGADDAGADDSVEGQTTEEISQTGTAPNITKAVTDNLPASVFGDTDQEKSSSLEELMTQYKSKSSKFEGLDKGMAIAKIGFAMAAGQSPNALTNIANAFSMGADMFIEDKKERDAFNRQLDLTALQYGMGELSKEKAQDRADKRDIRDFIVNKSGTYFGKEYKKDELITLTMQELIRLGPDAIKNFSSLEAFTERQDAIAATIGSNLFPYGSLKMSDLKGDFEEYKNNLVAAKDSEFALVALNDALLDTANKDLVSAYAAGKEVYGNILRATFGDDGTDTYNDLATFERKLGIALNAIIPSLIGDTQSANSISDRDVGFIISAFLSEGLVKRDKEGNYFLVGGSTAFLGKSQAAMARGLKAASDRIQIAQKTNLSNMLQFEETVGLLGIEGTTMTGADFMSRSIKERKLLTEGASSGSSLLYYWDPKAGGVKLAGQEA